VRQASITSEYGLDSGPIHSSRSSINDSTGSDKATSQHGFPLVGIGGWNQTQAAPPESTNAVQGCLGPVVEWPALAAVRRTRTGPLQALVGDFAARAMTRRMNFVLAFV
jgi:hypothetical protein